MRICLLILLTLSLRLVFAQPDTTQPAIQLKEVTVAASKFEQLKRWTPYQITHVSRQQIAFRNHQNTADLLMQTGHVFVQKSQGGGGSPVLRGFESSRVLIVIDGIRMNNAIYRAGHLQNVLRIDPSMLERAEVMFGPGSLIYGSDALGGVMYFQSRNPELSASNTWAFKPTAYVRYASATQEKTAHVDLNAGNHRLGFLSSITVADFGTIKQGNQRLEAYPTFGKLMQYVERRNGQDVVVTNPDPNRQVGTAYQQIDLLQKVLFQPKAGIRHTLNVQFSATGNVPRYDRLTEIANGLPRFAEWYYGPEKRLLTAYTLQVDQPAKLFDKALATVAYQQIEESRYNRRLNAAIRNQQLEKVQIWSLNADLIKKLGRHTIQYGLEATYNDVVSVASGLNLSTGTSTPISTRYPDGGSTVRTAGIYLSDQIQLTDQWNLTAGIRYNASQLNATFRDKTFFPFPFNEICQQPNGISGTLGLVFSPSTQTKLSLLGSSGFRAPNVDDLTKVFESKAGTLIVPNPAIKPEYTYNAELSASHWISDWLRLDATYYYTTFANAIVVDAFTFNGQRQLMYAGQLSNATASQNTREAYIRGWSGAAYLIISPRWLLTSTLTGTHARINDDKKTPLDHIPPTYGRTALQYQHKKLQAEAFLLYNGWKRLTDYNPEGEDNIQYATAAGMPAWTTLNLRTSYRLSSFVTVQAACENLLDRNYRYFASGVSAPGRNFIVTIRGNL